MGLFSRTSDDDRSAHDVVNDMCHDIYHRVTGWIDPNCADAKLRWPHAEDCEYLGDGESNGGKGWW